MKLESAQNGFDPQVHIDFAKAERTKQANEIQKLRWAKEQNISPSRLSHNYKNEMLLDGRPLEEGYKKIVMERRNNNKDKTLN